MAALGQVYAVRLFFNRQIVNVQVTSQAFREHFQKLRRMRFRWRVAVGAFRNQTVPGMAFSAADLTMLTRRGGPLVVDAIMAVVAGSQVDICCQVNLQWFMHFVAASTTGELLGFKVRFMALLAGRNVPVPLVVAGTTTLFRVLAWELFELRCLISVAIRAVSFQHS